MNSHQQTAIDNHCRFAFETAQAKFLALTENGTVSVILTVNSGYE
jgi:hypothetical protein